jgi:hypothetical protein
MKGLCLVWSCFCSGNVFYCMIFTLTIQKSFKTQGVFLPKMEERLSTDIYSGV